MRVVIPDFPMPPSSNQTRKSFFDRKNNKLRHFDAAVYKKYKAACEAWALDEYIDLRKVRALIQAQFREPQTSIRVDSYFAFHHGNIWTVDGTLKQMDASNRIKACHDELAKCMEIDDSYFQVGKAEKVWVPDHEPERVILVLTFDKFRSLEETELSLTLNGIS